jgi:hypothetical protein
MRGDKTQQGTNARFDGATALQQSRQVMVVMV